MARYAFFDTEYYLLNNPDVAASWTGAPEDHYYYFGADEGRAPAAWFDGQYYRASNPDLFGMSAADLFAHYNQFGFAEGRVPSSAFEEFDAARYLTDYPDLGANGIDELTALNHFLVYGEAEGRLAFEIGSDTPISGGSAGETFVLTTAVDNVVGTLGNDTIVGTFDGADTFSLGDQIDGNGGTDTLQIFTADYDLDFGVATIGNVQKAVVDVRTDGIGYVNVANNNFADLVLEGNNRELDDYVEFDNVQSTTTVTLQNVDADGESVDVYLNEQAAAINANFVLHNVDDADVWVYVDDSGNGSAADDVLTVTFDGVKNTDGDMEFYTTDVETFNVVVASDSELENVGNYYNNDGSMMGDTVVNLTANGDLHVGFWDFNDDSGATENTTFNIVGAGDVTIDEVDDGSSNLTIAAGTATGNIALYDLQSEVVSVTTGDGNDTVEIGSIDTVVVVGKGDDKVIVDTYLNDASDLNGDEGIDTLSLAAATAVAGVTTLAAKLGTVFENFEKIELSTGLAGVLDMANLDDIQDLTLAAGVAAASSVVGLETGATIENQENGGSALTVDGTQDVLNYIVNADTSTYTTLEAAGADTLNIESTTTAADPTAVSNDVHLLADAQTTINVTGDVELLLHHMDLISVETVAAGSFDAGLYLQLTSNTNDVTVTVGDGDNYIASGEGDDAITTGAGDDEILGRAGNDTIVAGDGENIIQGDAGLDTLTGGADVDTYAYAAAADSQGVTVDVITNFDVSEDVIDFSGLAGMVAPSYVGEANGYGAVLTSLTVGTSNAVLDSTTSILYFDVDGTGTLDDNDIAIQLTGITDLSSDNFAFV